MPRPRREDLRQETAEEIKATARRQMQERGTAGLSLRAIAREMEITAPAIYNYFPSLDDLITALIVDAFNAIGDAMENAECEVEGEAVAPKFWASALTYRAWALENPVQFQLIYGNPIPGYAAPAEITGPLAFRPFRGMFRMMVQGMETGEINLPPSYQNIPAEIAAHFETWKDTQSIADVPNEAIYALMSGWTRIHGMVILEILHHSTPGIGHTDIFYREEVKNYMRHLGMQIND